MDIRSLLKTGEFQQTFEQILTTHPHSKRVCPDIVSQWRNTRNAFAVVIFGSCARLEESTPPNDIDMLLLGGIPVQDGSHLNYSIVMAVEIAIKHVLEQSSFQDFPLQLFDTNYDTLVSNAIKIKEGKKSFFNNTDPDKEKRPYHELIFGPGANTYAQTNYDLKGFHEVPSLIEYSNTPYPYIIRKRQLSPQQLMISTVSRFMLSRI